VEAFRAGEFERADRLAQNAGRRMSPEDSSSPADVVAAVRLMPAYRSWILGDMAGAVTLARAAVEEMGSLPDTRRTEFGMHLVHLFAGLGRLDDAEQVAGRMPRDPRRFQAETLVLSAREDVRALRQKLVGGTWDERRRVPSLLIDTGLLDEARAVIAAQQIPSDHALGQLALAEGRLDEACARLNAAFERGLVPSLSTSSPLRAARKLAAALTAAGDSARAIGVLERASAIPRTDIAIQGWHGGSEWIRMRAQLADLYRARGRSSHAAAVEAELRGLLAVADHGHPLARRLTVRAASAR
jgi:hypothetical protein